MRKPFHSIFAVIALWLCAIAPASADGIGSYPSLSPAIAFDPGTDTGLVVYESGGRVYAKRIDNNGAPLPGSDIVVFPRVPSSRLKYKDPTVVFKTPQNRYYIAARQSSPTTRNFPEGPVTFDSADGIAVAVFDRQMVWIADRTLYSPGYLRNILITNAEAKPAIVVDNINDASCCVAVVWQDARQPFGFFMSRMNPGLDLYDPIPRLLGTSRSHIANLSATYDAARDRFVFAYDGCTSDVRYCVPFVANVPAYVAGAPIERELPGRSGSSGGYAYPDVGYIAVAGATLASWSWSASGSNGVSAMRVEVDDGGTIRFAPSSTEVGLSTPGCFFCTSVWARTRPDVVAIGGTRAMIVAPSQTVSLFTPAVNDFTGFVVDVAATPIAVSAAHYFSDDVSYIPSGRGAYSTSGRVVAAWDQGTIPYSVWAGAVTP